MSLNGPLSKPSAVSTKKIWEMSPEELKKQYISADDQAMAAGASVFTIAAQSKNGGMTASEATSKNESGQKAQGNLISLAKTAFAGVTKGSGLSQNVQALGQASTAAATSTMIQSTNFFGQVAGQEQKINQLVKDSEKTETEIQGLEAELAGLQGADGTGAGETSAYSLSLPGASNHSDNMGNDTGKGGLLSQGPSKAPDQSGSTGNGNESLIAEKQSQIESKQGHIASNGATIGMTAKNYKTQADMYAKNAMASIQKSNHAQQKAEATTNVLNGVSTGLGVVTTAAGVVDTVSSALVPPPPTTAVGVAGVATAKSTEAGAGAGSLTTNAGAKATASIFKSAAGELTKLGKTVSDIGKVSAKVAKWSNLATTAVGTGQQAAALGKKKA